MPDKMPLNEDSSKRQSDAIYRDTMYFVNGMVREFELYPEIMDALRKGQGSVELRKRYMLRQIDEAWVTIIEDSLADLDQVIRNPSRFLKEEEEVLPIELTRSISSRSIKHLAQHSDYISKIEGDEITPSKMLNVFRDETILTYENKFINTLLSRLYSFVNVRYEAALNSSVDTKCTSVEFNNEFTHKERHGRIHFRLELDEPAVKGEVEKNYLPISDLWKRVEKLNQICTDYMQSSFVEQMGKNYVHPPVMRTNAILKNKNLRQCLALWEFIESYENSGYSTVVDDTLMSMNEEYIREMYSTMAVEYLLFRNHVENGFDGDESIAHASIDEPLNPEIVADLTPPKASEFALHIAQIDRTVSERTVDQTELLRTLEVALVADELIRRREALGELDDTYDRSFLARLVVSQEPAQSFYTDIKNCLLSYNKVSGRISWKYERFAIGRKVCARVAIKGKTLCVYLPLDPKDEKYRQYRPTDMSEYSSYRDIPFCIKVKSRRALSNVLTLIAEVAESMGATKRSDFEPSDYRMASLNTEQMVEIGLIKLRRGKSETENDDADEPETVDALTVVEPVEETAVPEPEVIEETPEPEAVEATSEPETVEATPEPEVIEATSEPETVDATPEPETVEATPEPESVEATPEPETVEATPEPETVEATPEPESVEETPKSVENVSATETDMHEDLKADDVKSEIDEKSKKNIFKFLFGGHGRTK